MPDIVVDGLTKVSFVPTIGNIASPTAVELNAGTSLEMTLVPSGLEGFEASPAEVDNSAFGSTYGTQLPGIASFSGTRLVLKKQSGVDTVFTSLTTFNTAGHIVIRDGLAISTTFVAAQKVQVYPVRTGTWSYMNREKNSVLRYWVAVPVVTEPNMNATVA